MSPENSKTLSELSSRLRQEERHEDIRRAKNLRKSPSRRANLVPGSGPRVAR